MKKLLFVGHTYHKKTKSADFMKELLEQKYDITTFYFDPFRDKWSVFEALNNQEYDIVLLWQIMPSINLLKEYINFKHGVFFPMFDAIPPRHKEIWLEYIDFNIISFSKALHEELSTIGFSSYYIQYFPKPIHIDSFGDNKSIFFWQRADDITINTIEGLFNVDEINHLHFHQAIDPTRKIIEPSEKWNDKTTYSTWYEKKEDMQDDMKKASFYIAPRKYEGIGMSFLEAMAMGRCVVAPDYPTMNEYIIHNKTGILYDLDNPKKIDLNNIIDIQKNTADYIENGYKEWEVNKHIISNWFEEKPKVSRKLLKKVKKRKSHRNLFAYLFEISKKDNVTRVYILGLRVFKIVKEGR